jgi:LPXTG-motif cell wall-anchored protein
VDSRLIVGGIVLVALLIFVFQNTDETPLTFLFFDFTAPLWLMLAITVAISLGIGFLLGRRRRRE